MKGLGKIAGRLMSTETILFACLVSGSALILPTGSVPAQTLISARVLSSEGNVEIRRQPSNQPRVEKIVFKVDEELRAGDTIVTGRGGRLVLGLSDGSQAVIAAQTTVVIQDLKQSPRTLFNVIRGKTRIEIEKLGGQPNPYRVNTPTAVIAVRGTIFDVWFDGNATQVFVHEGEVAVTNLVFPNQPVTLFANQMTQVQRQHIPDRPGPFKGGHNDGIFQGIGRIAMGTPRPEPGRGGSPSSPGPPGPPPSGSRPSANPRPSGKRP